MGRAEEIFALIKSNGLTEIDRLIADSAAEELFLDFKGSRDSGPSNRLSDDDSANLAKAISGFGNSGGGVIVWGVDCRRDSHGAEVPTKSPLNDAAGFRKRIESAISRLTSPVHNGIANEVVLADSAPSGYVATLIPRPDFVPIRTILASLKNHYYVRVGDSFTPAPHELLEGLFGRHPAGKVWVQLFPHDIGVQAGSGAMSISFGFGLANGGVTLLERPYVSVHPGNTFTQQLLRVVASPGLESQRSQTANHQVYAGVTQVVVPGGLQDMCTIAFTIGRNAPTFESGLSIEITCGAANALPRRFPIDCSTEQLTRAVHNVRAGQPTSTGELFRFDELMNSFKVSA